MSEKKNKGFFSAVERVGNKIPDPMVFFLTLIVIVLAASLLLSLIGFSDVNPATGDTVAVYNLLSREGAIKMLTTVVSNFSSFSALGMTLTCMLGMSVAEKTGLFESVMRQVILTSKGSDAKIIIIFYIVSVLADITNGAGFVIMPLLGAVIWSNMGRNPIPGMICGYGAVAGAFSANFMVGSTDIICAGFTQSSAQIIDSGYAASAFMGWYFQSVAAVTLTIATYFVTVKIVEPRFSKPENSVRLEKHNVDPVEKAALRNAGISLLIFLAVIVILCVPQNGIMREAETGSLVSSGSPLIKSLVFLIALFFFIPGYVFGKKTGSIKNISDLITMLSDGIASMSRFIVLAFVMAQFMQYFSWSNIGTLIAIKGANALNASGLPFVVICVIFILFCGGLNLFMGSASAKYGILAPVFVPMFMLMGYSPTVAQMCYRIGDAITNPITPTFAYIAMLLVQVKKYDSKIGFGTLVASLLPYTVVFSIVLIIQFVIWVVFKIPFGPGEVLYWR